MCSGFLLFLMTVVALIYNCIGIIIAVIAANNFKGPAGSIILSIIYVIVGVPGAWIMWYKRLYLGMARDGALSFGGAHLMCCCDIWSGH